jgi:hypothetical protein
MKTTAVPLAALTILFSLGIVTASCAPEDLGRFGDGPVAPRPADGGINAPVGGCSLYASMAEIEQKLLRGPKCLLCHGKMSLFPTSFDVMSPDIAGRVVDRPAEGNPAKGKCGGKVLVPKDNPTAGVFFEKMEKATPSCGDRMPQSMMALSPDEIACMKAWVMMAAAGMKSGS